jgi:hypothetical protein
MAEAVTKLQVFVASPSDVLAERDAVSAVVAELNRSVAAKRNLVLDAVRWETHALPGVGEDAQDVVNQVIGPQDIFIGIMWKRAGSRTKRAASGTIEEFQRAYRLNQTNPTLKIFFYFNETPFYPRNKQEINEFNQVLKFKDGLRKQGVFAWSYQETSEFERLFREHLTKLIDEWNVSAIPPQPSLAAEIVKITVQQVQEVKRTPTAELAQHQLQPKKIAGNIYSPMSIHWFAEGKIALGSRDSWLRIIDPDGETVDQFETRGGYPSYVNVAGVKTIAAVTYTHATVIDLASKELRRPEIDSLAGGRVLEWSPDGQMLAVAGDNVLKFFTADGLEPIGRTLAVGGKLGVSTLTFAGRDCLYVGIVSGELWRMDRPFDTPQILSKRQSAPIGLRASPFDERVACFWMDGLLEIRNVDQVVAAVQLRGEDSWAAHGPKVCWASPETICCVTGTSSDLVLWHLSSGALAFSRLDRRALCLDANPSRTRLAVGLGEHDRGDAFVLLFDLAVLNKALSDSASPSGIRQESTLSAHRYTADWSALLDRLDHIRHDEEPGSKIELFMPVISERIKDIERSLESQKQELSPIVLRQINQSMRRAQRNAATIIDDLEWIGQRLLEKGMQESYITKAFDSLISVSINRIIGIVGGTDCPQIESLGEFTSYTLGVAQNDLLELDFETDDGRSAFAYVPFDFLLQIERLNEIGEALGEKYGATTDRQKVVAACQMFHEFDYAFGYNEQRELWARYVLPYSFVFRGRENLIDVPSDVVRFGLH